MQVNDHDFVFSDDDEDGALVVIFSDVVKNFLSHRQLTSTCKESGGVIIGERRGKHLVVRMISIPNQDDIRKRNFVDRIGAHHQKVVNKAFEDTDGTWQYLGEWHTHPEDYPSPSGTDLKSWNTNLKSNDPFVLIIVGRIKFWVAKKIGPKIISLKQL